MKYAIGDIWEYYDKGYYIVVPTNIGWNRLGENIMGRGVAHQAAQKFPELPQRYGKICKEWEENTTVVLFQDMRLILFPVKRLNSKFPYLSWKNSASITLVEKSLIELLKVVHSEILETNNPLIKIALPLVGCGNGKLDKAPVIAVLETYLPDLFTLVELEDHDESTRKSL